jgi:hypothetical protein
MKKRERIVERVHAEYAAFWRDAVWSDRVPRVREDAAVVYEIALVHPSRRRKRFVVHVGWATRAEAIDKKRSDVTPSENASVVRIVEIETGDARANVRKAVLIAGMCKSEFDYACAEGNKAVALPTLLGARLQRLTFSTGRGT